MDSSITIERVKSYLNLTNKTTIGSSSLIETLRLFHIRLQTNGTLVP